MDDGVQRTTAFGLDVGGLSPGQIPLECVALVKVLNTDGQTGVLMRRTEEISGWETLGIVTMAKDLVSKELLDQWEPEKPAEGNN